jgi:hypothetical protein
MGMLKEHYKSILDELYERSGRSTKETFIPWTLKNVMAAPRSTGAVNTRGSDMLYLK